MGRFVLLCLYVVVMTHSGASSGGGRMMDVDAITGGIPSSTDIGDLTQQEENDLKGGTMKQSSTPYENESCLNRESTGASGSEDQQTDPDTINPRSECVLELGPDGDVDSEVVLPTRTTRTDSLTGVEAYTNVTNDQAGVIGEQSTVSMGFTGCSEAPIETSNHQQPISPQASEIEIDPEEEILAKVGNSKAADSEDEKACRMSPEQGEISQSNNGAQGDLGVDNSSECIPPSHPTVAPAKPHSFSGRAQMEKSLTNADHLQPAGINTAKPVQYQGQTKDVGNNNSSHDTQGDLGVGDSSENAPPFNPPVAGVVAQTKHSTLSRREKKTSNADHLQPAGTHTVKPLEYQGQPEDVVNNSLHSVRGVSGAQNSFEYVSPSNATVAVAPAEHSYPSRREKKLTTAYRLQPEITDNGKPFKGQGQSEYFGHYENLHDVQVDLMMDDFSKRVAVAGAPAKHRSSKTKAQLERKLSNADHLQPAGTNNAKADEYQEQTAGVGHNDSSHGARGELGKFNTFETLSAYYPTVLVGAAQRANSSRQAQVDKKPSNADHLQPAGTNNVKPFDFQGQGLQANLSRGPQAEQKPTNAYHYQLASSNNGKHPEDQGQGLQQGHRREGVGHMTSLHSMQGDFARIQMLMSTSPQNFQQPSMAGARSGVYQSDQAGYSRTSLVEHVQPQRPQVSTKVSKLGPCDGERQSVPVTQHQTEDPKPANKGAQANDWSHRCKVAWFDNDKLERELYSHKTQLWKKEQEIQELKLKLKQSQENTELLSNQISKYEQQHAQEIHRSGSYLDDSKAATPALLVSALNGVKDASNNFAKVFKAQVDSSPSTLQADIKQHLSENVGQVSRIGHIKFQYQAFVCQHLFEGFDHRNFGLFESTPGLPVTTVEHCFRQYQMHDFKKSDTVERLFQRDPEIDNFLHEYCFRKFSLIFNRQLEERLFDGKLEHNDSIDKYEHPCYSRFYRSYCKLAVSIWLVHRLAFSFNQPAKLFRPLLGTPFNTSNMQSVVPLDSASDEEEVQLRVGFCVIPGMKVGESIVPSEVYVFGQ